MDDQSNVFLRAMQPAPGPLRSSRAAIVSFAAALLSLAGLVSGPWLTGSSYVFLFFIPAIIAGHFARREFRKSPGAFRNESMATFGLAVGYLGLFLSIFVICVLVFRAAPTPTP